MALTILELQRIFRKNFLDCDDEALKSLMDYSELLLEWNKKINLISRRDEENILERHIILSLAPFFRFEFVQGTTVLDLGTGGGLPGIPLAILFRNSSFTLIDSIQKKMVAVKEMSQSLKLKNVSLLTGRAEQLSKEPKLRASFDYVVSRAVSSVADIVRWSKPFLRASERLRTTGHSDRRETIPPGSIVLYKGGDLSAEMREAEMRVKPAIMTTHALVIDGIDPQYAHEKKFIIIQP